MADDRISEHRAAAALERAAQLQLEAAERVERSTTAVATRQGYGRQELEAAAAEAGIEPRFLELALREQALAKVEPSSDSDAALLRWLGTRQRSLSVSRVFDGDLDATVAACCRVFESEKVRLELRGEAEPMRRDAGGVLEFHMPRLSQLMSSTGKYTSLAYRLEQLEMWTLHASFRPIGERTEVVVVGDLRSGAHANLRVARIGGVLGGGVGVASGLAFGLTAMAAIPAVALGATGVGLMALAYRALYRSILRKTEAELEGVLATVAGDLSRKALVPE
ncbi:MAG: hypothetical protein ACE37F_21175 [Nannocystaceae bacterium]|nr:hypothetical protein [bacterium]